MDHCYIVTNNKTGKIELSTESAFHVAGFLWGKDNKKFTAYKAVRLWGDENVSDIQRALEER